MSTSELVTPNTVEKMNFLSRIETVQNKPSKPVHMSHHRQAYLTSLVLEEVAENY